MISWDLVRVRRKVGISIGFLPLYPRMSPNSVKLGGFVENFMLIIFVYCVKDLGLKRKEQ